MITPDAACAASSAKIAPSGIPSSIAAAAQPSTLRKKPLNHGANESGASQYGTSLCPIATLRGSGWMSRQASAPA